MDGFHMKPIFCYIMTVYVDNAFIPMGRFKMCHMSADNLEELHAFALSIGLKREWFQDKRIPHYDISISKRLLAISKGAKSISSREFVTRFKR